MSTNRDRLEQEAMNLLQRGQAAKALEYYLALLRHDPRDLRIRKKVAEIYLHLGRVPEAEKHLRDLADALVGSGQQRAAISVLKQLVEFRADDPVLWERLGDCYQKCNFPGDARDSWETAMRLLGSINPARSLSCARKVAQQASNDIPAQVRVAELYERNGDSAGALECWTTLASEARRRGSAADTARFYERALTIDTADLESLQGAAEARLQMSDGRKALSHLQAAYKLDQLSIETITLLARSFEALGLQPKARQVWLQAARIHEENGTPVERAAALRNALRCGPEEDELVAAVGEAEREAEPFRLRLDLCDWAVPTTPAEVQAVVRAQVQARYGFPERATETLRGAGTNLSRATPILVALAELLAEQGDREGASNTLRQVKPPSEEAAEQIATRRRVLLGVEEGDDARLVTSSDEIIDDEDDAFGPGGSEPPLERLAGALPAVEPIVEDDIIPELIEDDADQDEADGPSVAEAEAAAEQLAADGDRAGAIAAFRAVLAIDAGNEQALVRIGELMAEDSGQGHPASTAGADKAAALDDDLTFGSGLFGSLSEGTYAEVDPARFSIDDDLELLDHDSFEARARFEVGLYQEAVALLSDLDDLHSRTLAARAVARIEGAASAAQLLTDAVDSADPESTGFPEAQWILSGLLVEAGKLAAAQGVLEQLAESAPEHRTVERAARSQGIELLLER